MAKNNAPRTIYAIMCNETKRVYIGCCLDIDSRIAQHFRELKKQSKTVRLERFVWEKSQWQLDYDQYGKDSFSAYILEKDVPAETCRDVEAEYILKYRANEHEFGYNLRLCCRRDIVPISDGAPPLPLERDSA